MKITLRKAHALQSAITDEIRWLNFSTQVELNEFQSFSIVLAQAAAAFNNNIDKRADLYDTMYSLRKSVSVANNAAGVDFMLADIARAEKDIAFYGFIDRAEPRLEHKVLDGKLGKLKEKTEPTRSLYSSTNDVVETGIFSASNLENFRIKLMAAKKQKQALQDKLLETNIRTEVELSTDEEAVLRNADLL